jgi:hypothetical protein
MTGNRAGAHLICTNAFVGTCVLLKLLVFLPVFHSFSKGASKLALLRLADLKVGCYII